MKKAERLGFNLASIQGIVTCPRCNGAGYMGAVNGKKLRAERKMAGITLREVARVVGISAAFLSDIELGRRQPSRMVREALVECIGRSRRQRETQ